MRRYFGGPQAPDPLFLPKAKVDAIRKGMFNIAHEGQQGNWQVCQGSMHLPDKKDGENVAKLASYRWRELQAADGGFRWEILWAVAEQRVMTPEIYKKTNLEGIAENMRRYSDQFRDSTNWLNLYRADALSLKNAKSASDMNRYQHGIRYTLDRVRSEIKERESLIKEYDDEWKQFGGDIPFPAYWINYRKAVQDDIALLKRSLPIEPGSEVVMQPPAPQVPPSQTPQPQPEVAQTPPPKVQIQLRATRSRMRDGSFPNVICDVDDRELSTIQATAGMQAAAFDICSSNRETGAMVCNTYQGRLSNEDSSSYAFLERNSKTGNVSVDGEITFGAAMGDVYKGKSRYRATFYRRNGTTIKIDFPMTCQSFQ